MSLDEFKTIYWWEWTHRFLGRLIGVVFLVPFVVFWIAGYIPRALLPRLIGLFVLGGLQGAIGWYMVKSGLVDRTSVSQYRLMVHFGLAVAILGYTLWLLFDLGTGAQTRHARAASARRLGSPALVLALIFLQLLAGALGGGTRRRHGLQHLAADRRRVHPERPRRGHALVSQPVREPACGAVQSPHARLCRGGRRRSRKPSGLRFAARAAARCSAPPRRSPCCRCCKRRSGVWTLLLAVPIDAWPRASGRRHRWCSPPRSIICG